MAEDLYDWEKSTSRLAAQAPWWEPGTASGYHMANYGHLVGEVVRRITGLKLGAFYAKEIAQPLEADFHIGLAPSEFHRVSNVVLPPALPIDFASLDMNSPMAKTFTGPAPQAGMAWTDEWRRADIGAGNGHGNARSVAKVQSVISNGGEAGGVRLLSDATIDLIFQEQANGVDLVLGVPIRFGIGYGLPNEMLAVDPEARACFWGGWGGSLVVNDLEHRMTVAYVMNRMEGGLVGDQRGTDLLLAAEAAVG